MDLLHYTESWVKGEVLQGKTMLVLGSLLLIGGIMIFRADNPLLRGMLIPLGLIVLFTIGYGGMQVFSRPNHLKTVSESFSKDPQQTILNEYAKAQKDDKVYGVLRRVVWPACIIISLCLYLFLTAPYYKGLGIGLLSFFTIVLLVDSLLHHRLSQYFKGLSSML